MNPEKWDPKNECVDGFEVRKTVKEVRNLQAIGSVGRHAQLCQRAKVEK